MTLNISVTLLPHSFSHSGHLCDISGLREQSDIILFQMIYSPSFVVGSFLIFFMP